MINLSGKRLLFMGATDMMKSAVILAKSMGITTIVVDYNEKSPAKAFADKSYLVSTANIDEILKICKKEGIDGVFFGYSELNQYYTLDICTKLNLPFYADKNQINILANKKNFKNYCKKFNITVVPEYNINNINELPVIVKPVDSYSGKGISICYDLKELKECIDQAINESKTKSYLIEKYMDPDKYDVVGIYYSIQNGIVALSSMADRIMYKFNNNRQLNTALIYPSVYLDRYLATEDKAVKDMIKDMGIQNGTIFIEGCVDKEKFYFWEAGFRLCGAEQDILPTYINKVNIKKMLICHALTGKMDDKDNMALEDPYFKNKKACNGIIFLNKGMVTKISGVDEIKKLDGVINFSQLKSVNDKITDKDIGTLNQSFARFHIVADSIEELKELIYKILNKIIVLDENGNNMILNTFDENTLNLKIKKQFVK